MKYNKDLYLEMLTYKRPAWSKAEYQYIERFIAPHAFRDEFGNYHVIIGDNPAVLFSSHTDTVHNKSGRQHPVIGNGFVSCPKKSNCLGADDTTGNFIMLCMIEAGVQGHYIFHRAEEIGGRGSLFIMNDTPEILQNINHAVAFDRRGTEDILTHQGFIRGCSEVYAHSLAAQLGMNHVPDDTGIFTDTATYFDAIPECTNISVGYDNEHTKWEIQDLDYLFELIPAILAVDWNALPIDHNPKGYDMVNYIDHNAWGNMDDAEREYYTRLIEMNPDAVYDLLVEHRQLSLIEDYVFYYNKNRKA